jgi:hypothetical protein
MYEALPLSPYTPSYYAVKHQLKLYSLQVKKKVVPVPN